MQNTKWSGVVAGVVVGLSALLLPSCCSTYRMHCSPELNKLELQLPAGLRFNLATVEFVSPTNVGSAWLSDFGVIYLTNTELRAHLMQHAEKAYPGVFSASADALPLQVTIQRDAYTDNAGAGNCVACLTLTVFPLPIDEKVDYTVQVKTAREELNTSLGAPVFFCREQVGRASCLPTGWIPATGGKGESISDTERAQKTCEAMMLNSSVQAIVTALRRVNPAMWTAPAR
jgi:hypothetical protein